MLACEFLLLVHSWLACPYLSLSPASWRLCDWRRSLIAHVVVACTLLLPKRAVVLGAVRVSVGKVEETRLLLHHHLQHFREALQSIEWTGGAAHHMLQFA